MLNVYQELGKPAGSRYFPNFDLWQGYWQLHFGHNSKGLQSFVTSTDIITPTHVLHGNIEAFTHLQSVLAEKLPVKLRKHVLYFLDDILVHHATDSGLPARVQRFFKLCTERSMRPHLGKCVLCAISIRWRGRLVSHIGIR